MFLRQHRALPGPTVRRSRNLPPVSGILSASNSTRRAGSSPWTMIPMRADRTAWFTSFGAAITATNISTAAAAIILPGVERRVAWDIAVRVRNRRRAVSGAGRAPGRIAADFADRLLVSVWSEHTMKCTRPISRCFLHGGEDRPGARTEGVPPRRTSAGGAREHLHHRLGARGYPNHGGEIVP